MAQVNHTRSLYEGSSQFKHWRYSAESLQILRGTLNDTAVQAIRSTFEKELVGSSGLIQFLTATDEAALVKLYISKIPQLCSHFRFPDEVEATAMTYLKRFYLKNTVMDWHPRNIMLTTLFLATKTTNHPIALDVFVAAIPKTTTADVLDLEFLVAQSLGFEFAVWHAHRAFWGIWLDIQTLSEAEEDMQTIYTTAQTYIRASRLTDAELVYAPAQIALACLYLASQTLAERWAKAKGEEEVLGIIQPLAKEIEEQGTGPDVELVREVDKRLKVCKNPEKVVGSRAYFERMAADEAAAEEKRNRKAQGQAVDDPFGNVMDVDADDE